MGYRSDVRIATTDKGYERFLELVPDEFKDPRYRLFDKDGTPSVYEAENDGVVFGWDYVKWYDEYKDVTAIMSAMRRAAKDHSFEYIRVGEDSGDVEELVFGDTSDLYMHLGVRSEIYVW